MVFSSIEFLFLFFPIFLICYYLCPNKGKNIILLAFSLLFYGAGEPKNIFLLLGASLLAYINGIIIERQEGGKKIAVFLSVAENLALLFYFKYLNLFSDIFSLNLKKVALPIGISFYTFQIISYLADVYRGDIKAEKDPIKFFTYVSMFPQLIAGPIVRYSEIAASLDNRKVNYADYGEGLMRFLRGLFKKVLLADRLGALFKLISESANISSASAVLGAVCFTAQIYFDFSGYADMAIGIGKMIGFSFPENFNYPYISRSVTEFWRRWHITLSGWFKDYVYIPLGGNRCKKARHIFNLALVWTLTGAWHGAALNFVLWGMYYGILLTAEKYLWGKFLKKLPSPVKIAYTLAITVFGFTIFAFDDFSALKGYLSNVFFNKSIIDTGFLFYLQNYSVTLFFAIIFSTPIAKKFKETKYFIKHEKAFNVLSSAAYILLFILCVIYVVSSSYSPFLYFRF